MHGDCQYDMDLHRAHVGAISADRKITELRRLLEIASVRLGTAQGAFASQPFRDAAERIICGDSVIGDPKDNETILSLKNDIQTLHVQLSVTDARRLELEDTSKVAKLQKTIAEMANGNAAVSLPRDKKRISRLQAEVEALKTELSQEKRRVRNQSREGKKDQIPTAKSERLSRASTMVDKCGTVLL